jgi:Na+-driven multidrug efflux pump
VAIASRIGLAVAAIVGTAFLLIPTPLLGIFGMTEPLVTSIGSQLLRFLSVSGFFVTIALSYTGGLQGTGDTRSPLYISIVSQIVIPIGICATLQWTRGLHATDIWLAIVLGHFTRASLSVLRFRQGRWRNIAVELEETPTGTSRSSAARPLRTRA